MGTEGRQFVLWAFGGEGVEEERWRRRAQKGEEGGGKGEVWAGRKRCGWGERDDALG